MLILFVALFIVNVLFVERYSFAGAIAYDSIPRTIDIMFYDNYSKKLQKVFN